MKSKLPRVTSYEPVECSGKAEWRGIELDVSLVGAARSGLVGQALAITPVLQAPKRLVKALCHCPPVL